MKFLLLLFLFLGSSHGKKPVIQPEEAELNTCYSNGEECYTQILFWRWNHEYLRYDISAWTLVDRAAIYPHAQGWTIDIRGEGRVVVPHLRRSHTSVENDPERLNKKLTGDSFRIPLFPRNYKTK